MPIRIREDGTIEQLPYTVAAEDKSKRRRRLDKMEDDILNSALPMSPLQLAGDLPEGRSTQYEQVRRAMEQVDQMHRPVSPLSRPEAPRLPAGHMFVPSGQKPLMAPSIQPAPAPAQPAPASPPKTMTVSFLDRLLQRKPRQQPLMMASTSYGVRG